MKKKILVIDDDILIRAMVRKELEKLGYAVEVSSDGDRGLQRLEIERYDMVVTDINMPNMSGLELIKRIRTSSSEHSTVPILCITGEEAESAKQQAKEIGANGWIQKPLNPSTWERTLSKLLA